ncbi:MAG: hypothetical protein HYV26_08210 [Candidatus Hydrogenedentes bacterium]|nr:hypothetical protein [Candidatus Hydrogenedentota bacterium]
MAQDLSKSQIDRLGQRLKKSTTEEVDLELLMEFRRSFTEAYKTVADLIRERLQMMPTGRPLKTVGALTAKLRRESIRLTQVQDIAGCRLVVDSYTHQESTAELLRALFPGAMVFDRRAKPSHGYRAVHIIVRIKGKSVEIQVRTYLQHLWAALSEKMADRYGPEIKYGGGKESLRLKLAQASERVRSVENMEAELAALADPKALEGQSETRMRFAGLERRVQTLQKRLDHQRRDVTDYLQKAIDDVDRSR